MKTYTYRNKSSNFSKSKLHESGSRLDHEDDSDIQNRKTFDETKRRRLLPHPSPGNQIFEDSECINFLFSQRKHYIVR